MEASRADGTAAQPVPALRRGWLRGSADFLDRVLDKETLQPKPHHTASERAESAGALTARLAAEGLAVAGLHKTDLGRLRKGAPETFRLARVLRAQTTLRWRKSPLGSRWARPEMWRTCLITPGRQNNKYSN